jgi:hypothetical protein
VRNQLEDFHHRNLNDAQMRELNVIIRNATYTVLHALKEQDRPSIHTLSFVALSIPSYQEEPELTKEFKELTAHLNNEDVEDMQGYYGNVVITGGRYKGKVGLYDDDEGDKAVVYLAGNDDYKLIQHKYLKKAPPAIAVMDTKKMAILRRGPSRKNGL